MKQLEYLKILKLAKRSVREYVNWDENEIYKIQTSNISSKIIEKVLNSKEKLDNLKKEVNYCKKCHLGKNRLNAVFGSGSPNADLMFIGEAPGYDEDHKGEPFIGRAGVLLTKIIKAMNMARERVYITNLVKCHPMIDPSNPEQRANDRPPTYEEMKICRNYLDIQLAIVKPKIIVTLGASSTKELLNSEESISKIRGIIKEYKGIKLIPTYHPAAILRNSNLKKFVWEDMKKVVYYLNTDTCKR
jgi:DNA polymerase